MATRKGTITVDGKKINWSQTDENPVVYSDGKTAKPLASNMDAKLGYKTAVIPPKPPITPKLTKVSLTWLKPIK